MMTWVSLRSGMASSGTRRSDQAPPTAAAPISRRTRNLFRTEKSMTLSITGGPPRSRGLGVLRRFGVEPLLAVVGAEVVGPALVLRRPARRGRALLVHLHAAHRVLGHGAEDAPAGGHHAALGVDQERARDHDALADHQPPADLNLVGNPPARLDRPGLEVPVAPVDEDGLAQARVNDRFRGNRQRRG